MLSDNLRLSPFVSLNTAVEAGRDAIGGGAKAVPRGAGLKGAATGEGDGGAMGGASRCRSARSRHVMNSQLLDWVREEVAVEQQVLRWTSIHVRN